MEQANPGMLSKGLMWSTLFAADLFYSFQSQFTRPAHCRGAIMKICFAASRKSLSPYLLACRFSQTSKIPLKQIRFPSPFRVQAEPNLSSNSSQDNNKLDSPYSNSPSPEKQPNPTPPPPHLTPLAPPPPHPSTPPRHPLFLSAPTSAPAPPLPLHASPPCKLPSLSPPTPSILHHPKKRDANSKKNG